MQSQSEIIKDAMRRQGINTAGLAEKIGKTPQYAGQVVNGKRIATHPQTVNDIANAIGINSDHLYMAIGRLPPDVVQRICDKPSLMRTVREAIDLEQ